MEMNSQLQALDALPSGKDPKYQLNKRLDGPTASLDTAEETNITFPSQESYRDSSVLQPAA
jgi:hypothetical protein